MKRGNKVRNPIDDLKERLEKTVVDLNDESIQVPVDNSIFIARTAISLAEAYRDFYSEMPEMQLQMDEEVRKILKISREG